MPSHQHNVNNDNKQKSTTIVTAAEAASRAATHHLDNQTDMIFTFLYAQTIPQKLTIPQWKESDSSFDSKSTSSLSSAFCFSSFDQFDRYIKHWTEIIRQNMYDNNYDTFVSYLKFYRSYKRACQQQGQSAIDVTEYLNNSYQVEIDPESLSCVGLSYSLYEDLKQKSSLLEGDKSICHHFQMVSCHEYISVIVDNYSSQFNKEVNNQTTLSNYDIKGHELLKRHTVVCFKFSILDRKGYVIFDPGYHIGFPIVAMCDGVFPHTGWFVTYERHSIYQQRKFEVSFDY